ncbi:MAG: 30S ribosomal protein S9 [Halobacteriota archaeon]|nr:30S ribosomal protein S9 [Halobacteriota archaeon]
MVKIINSSGKKKTAVARATIKKGTGRVRINKKPLEIIEPESVKQKILEVLFLAGDVADEIDIDVKVFGGGFMGQADATRTAIAKGIFDWTNDNDIKDAFLSSDRNLLVSDHRKKEPKKYGGKGARAKTQKSYR